MERKFINKFDTSYNITSEKEHALVCFYSFWEKLIYEKQYSTDKKVDEIIEELFKKISEEKLKHLLKVNKNVNKKNFLFFLRRNNNYEEINKKNIPISSYIYNIQDTIALLYHSNLTTAISNIIQFKIYISIKNENVSEKIEEYISTNMHLIGRPIINKLKYYIYNKYTKKLKINKYSKDDINHLKLKNFTSLDSYCNAKNYLYIYESNFKYDLMDSNNRFFCINLITNKINIISTNFPNRILHSMIFIPEGYIFIIGGKLTKEVLKYEIKKDNINYEKYPFLLPYELLEPSLIYINNKYLYIFENSTLEFKILRNNLNFISPFEIIKLNIQNNKIINQKFFGVVENKNSILFLGGQMINCNHDSKINCFEFNYNSNTICLSNKEFKPYDLIEKTFIPLGNKIFMQLTEFKNKNNYEPKILIFNGNSE